MQRFGNRKKKNFGRGRLEDVFALNFYALCYFNFFFLYFLTSFNCWRFIYYNLKTAFIC